MTRYTKALLLAMIISGQVMGWAKHYHSWTLCWIGMAAYVWFSFLLLREFSREREEDRKGE